MGTDPSEKGKVLPGSFYVAYTKTLHNMFEICGFIYVLWILPSQACDEKTGRRCIFVWRTDFFCVAKADSLNFVRNNTDFTAHDGM
jgi:hypothetical protein